MGPRNKRGRPRRPLFPAWVRAGLLVLAGALIRAQALPTPAMAAAMTVGVVRDGPSEDDRTVDRIEQELERLARTGVEVRLKRDPAFDAGWDPGRMRSVLEAALRDREVDVVLVAGLLTLEEAVSPDRTLAKPVVSATEVRADFLRDREAGQPFLKPNLNVTVIPRETVRDVESFRSLIHFDRIHLLVDEVYADHLHSLQDVVATYQDSLGLEIVMVPVTGRVAEDVARIGDDAQAILLATLPRFSEAERQDLIEALTARQLPVFSLEGHADVAIGALAGFTPDVTDVVARRVALNLTEIARGKPVEELPVILPVSSQLLVNGRTLAALGARFDYFTLARAKVLYKEALEAEAPRLTLAGVFAEAERHNLSLMIANQEVESARQEANRARSTLLPQIGADARYTGADPRTLRNLIPDRTASAGVSGSQMLYDDRRISDFRAQKRLHEGTVEGRERVRLDVLRDAGTAYLGLALSRALFDVAADNLELSEDNLELSRRRFEVGYSGRDEVYRWEAEVAQGRGDLYTAAALVEERRIALNQVLGIEQDRRWTPEEITIDDQVFPFLDGRLAAVFADPRLWDRFRAVAVELAVENAPELAAIDKTAEAQGIRLGQRRRSFLLPALDVRGAWDYTFYRDPDFNDVPKDFYRFEVAATYPLFEGGRRLHEVRQFAADLSGIERQTLLTRDLVERRTRTALSNVEASFPIIGFSRQAAASSRQNLDVVRDKYAQGIVNVTDLLEAQSQSFRADRNATAAVYQFLGDLVELERALGWFEDERTPEERDALVQRIMEAIHAP